MNLGPSDVKSGFPPLPKVTMTEMTWDFNREWSFSAISPFGRRDWKAWRSSKRSLLLPTPGPAAITITGWFRWWVLPLSCAAYRFTVTSQAKSIAGSLSTNLVSRSVMALFRTTKKEEWEKEEKEGELQLFSPSWLLLYPSHRACFIVREDKWRRKQKKGMVLETFLYLYLDISHSRALAGFLQSGEIEKNRIHLSRSHFQAEAESSRSGENREWENIVPRIFLLLWLFISPGPGGFFSSGEDLEGEREIWLSQLSLVLQDGRKKGNGKNLPRLLRCELLLEYQGPLLSVSPQSSRLECPPSILC